MSEAGRTGRATAAANAPPTPAGASLNESGPWGKGGGQGSGQGGGGKKSGGRPGRRETPLVTPSALDALVRRGRARFGRRRSPPPVATIAGWIAAAAILAWLGLTGLHVIGAQQRGVITRFGRYAGTLAPGLGATLPWPIDTVHRIDVDAIHAIDVDASVDSDDDAGRDLALTADQALVDLAYTVRWTVRDPEPYLFGVADPERLIREVADGAMREAIARLPFDQAVGAGRGDTGDRVAQRIQALLDRYHAGIAIQGVAIRQADPPAEIADAVKEVAAAAQDAQTYRNNAHAYTTQVVANASGEAIAFDKVYQQYKLAPEVTRRRIYYETMEKVLAKTDKVIVAAPGVTPYLPIQPKAAK